MYPTSSDWPATASKSVPIRSRALLTSFYNYENCYISLLSPVLNDISNNELPLLHPELPSGLTAWSAYHTVAAKVLRFDHRAIWAGKMESSFGKWYFRYYRFYRSIHLAPVSIQRPLVVPINVRHANSMLNKSCCATRVRKSQTYKLPRNECMLEDWSS